MSPGEKALKVAQSQIGVKELTGNNDGVPSERYLDGEKKSWCAAFIAFCYREAGIQLPGNKWLLPSVSYMQDKFRAFGWWISPSNTPVPGDVIFFHDRGESDAGKGNHVGIIEAVEGRFCRTIEGNIGNAVGRRLYTLGDRRIAGFGRVPELSSTPQH